MAISETTKRIVASKRAQLRQQFDRNLEEIAEWRRLIKMKQDENATLKAQADALKNDIPEPTPVEV